MNTDGMVADARKALEQEWMRARQPMYEPRRAAGVSVRRFTNADEAIAWLREPDAAE